MVSLTKVSIDMSYNFSWFLEAPWPLKSNAINVEKCLISLAKQAKLIEECPAPWIQKINAP